MKNVLLLSTILLLGLSENVSAQGIRFEKVNFPEAQEMAKEDGRLIFIDVYTTWCGPCKMLAKTVFVDSSAGACFNGAFVCVQLDAEREGKEVAKRYGVSAYPTLLFLTADGELLHKDVGTVAVDALIDAGKFALREADNPNNLVKLKKRYEQGERNEQFLRKYIEKMVANKEKPYEAIEEYLKVQTTMRENSSKMMEFFIEYADFLLLGGEAERIFVANRPEYMAIATRLEEKKLSQVYPKMLRLTQQMAMKNKDVEQYRLFMERWLQSDDKADYQDYNDFRLDLLLLQNDVKAYRKFAFIYLDSIVSSRSVEAVRQKDEQRYEEFCKKNEGRVMYFDILKTSWRDVDAKLQTKAILKAGNQLLKDARHRDFKRFVPWIEHGKQLLPSDYRMTDFEADVLYRQGKWKEAIAAKRKALDMLNPSQKEYHGLQRELEKWEMEMLK